MSLSIKGAARTTPDLKKAEQEATRLLNKIGSAEPPINPVDVASNLGIKVSYVKFEDKYKDKIASFFDVNSSAIYVNEEENPFRQTFAIAHEIAHKILHPSYLVSANYKVLLRPADSSFGKDHIELEADAFASSLLVPLKYLDRYQGVATVADLAQLFVVSEMVIRNRLKRYGNR